MKHRIFLFIFMLLVASMTLSAQNLSPKPKVAYKNHKIWIFNSRYFTVNDTIARFRTVKKALKSNPMAYQVLNNGRLMNNIGVTLLSADVCYILANRFIIPKSTNKELELRRSITESVVSSAVLVVALVLDYQAKQQYAQAVNIYNGSNLGFEEKKQPELHVAAVGNGIGLRLDF